MVDAKLRERLEMKTLEESKIADLNKPPEVAGITYYVYGSILYKDWDDASDIDVIAVVKDRAMYNKLKTFQLSYARQQEGVTQYETYTEDVANVSKDMDLHVYYVQDVKAFMQHVLRPIRTITDTLQFLQTDKERLDTITFILNHFGRDKGREKGLFTRNVTMVREDDQHTHEATTLNDERLSWFKRQIVTCVTYEFLIKAASDKVSLEAIADKTLWEKYLSNELKLIDAAQPKLKVDFYIHDGTMRVQAKYLETHLTVQEVVNIFVIPYKRETQRFINKQFSRTRCHVYNIHLQEFDVRVPERFAGNVVYIQNDSMMSMPGIGVAYVAENRAYFRTFIIALIVAIYHQPGMSAKALLTKWYNEGRIDLTEDSKPQTSTSELLELFCNEKLIWSATRSKALQELIEIL